MTVSDLKLPIVLFLFNSFLNFRRRTKYFPSISPGTKANLLHLSSDIDGNYGGESLFTICYQTSHELSCC